MNRVIGPLTAARWSQGERGIASDPPRIWREMCREGSEEGVRDGAVLRGGERGSEPERTRSLPGEWRALRPPVHRGLRTEGENGLVRYLGTDAEGVP